MHQKLLKCEMLITYIHNFTLKFWLSYHFFVRAEAATKAKFEKVAEIKRLNAQLVTIKK